MSRRFAHRRGVGAPRPEAGHADKAYDSAANRAWLRRRGIGRRIAGGGGEPPAGAPTRGGVLGAAWAASLAGGAGAVVVELLAAAPGVMGPRLGAVVCVRAAGLRGDRH